MYKFPSHFPRTPRPARRGPGFAPGIGGAQPLPFGPARIRPIPPAGARQAQKPEAISGKSPRRATPRQRSHSTLYNRRKISNPQAARANPMRGILSPALAPPRIKPAEPRGIRARARAPGTHFPCRKMDKYFHLPHDVVIKMYLPLKRFPTPFSRRSGPIYPPGSAICIQTSVGSSGFIDAGTGLLFPSAVQNSHAFLIYLIEFGLFLSVGAASMPLRQGTARRHAPSDRAGRRENPTGAPPEGQASGAMTPGNFSQPARRS